ncbi:MAG: sulfotransferase [Candidatus Hodarchaeota archaeon]
MESTSIFSIVSKAKVLLFPHLQDAKARLYPHVPDYLSYRRGKYKNIFLLGSRRSGSTHLSRILSCDRGVRLIDQPFDLFKPHTQVGRIKAAHLPSMPNSQFITLSDGQEVLVRKYISRILEGRLKPLGGIERWGFPFLANRTVLKICNASPLIDWFNAQFNVSIVYLLRHPISQALSVIWNKWGITARAYINNESFVRSYLDRDKSKLAHEILSKGTYFEKAILNWCLENIVPLKHCGSEVLAITYEDLVLDPVATIKLLSNRLGLKNIRGMLRMIRVPSQPAFSEEKTKDAIREGKREFLIGRWREQVSVKQLDYARRILETFGIFEYRIDSPLPAERANSAWIPIANL